MTLSSRHRFRNSNPGGLRPSTLPLGHGGSPQYWLSHVDGGKTFCLFQTAETGNRTPNSGVKGRGANHYPRAPALRPKSPQHIYCWILCQSWHSVGTCRWLNSRCHAVTRTGGPWANVGTVLALGPLVVWVVICCSNAEVWLAVNRVAGSVWAGGSGNVSRSRNSKGESWRVNHWMNVALHCMNVKHNDHDNTLTKFDWIWNEIKIMNWRY